MKVFITDLEAYNNGHLVGQWVALPLTGFELQQAVSEVLTEGEHISDTKDHEEIFITDYECDYMKIDEYSNIYKLNEIAEQMEALDEHERTAVQLLLENGIATDLDDAIEKIDEMINTGETRMEDVAYNYVDECGMLEGLASSLQCYFDYEALGRDMEINGSYFEDSDGIIWECVA